MNPAGVVNAVFTVTGTSTAGLNSTVQIRLTSDPKGGIGLGMLLDSITEVGAGTANYDRNGRQFLKIEGLQPTFMQLPQLAA